MTNEKIRLMIQLEVKEALKDLSATSGGLQKMIKDAAPAAAAMKGVEKEIRKTSQAAKDFAKKAKDVGRNFSLFVTAPLLAAGTAAVKSAADFEKQQKAFEVLLGNAEKGSKLFQELKQFSASTPLQLGDITSASQKLLAFGTASEDITDELRKLGDLAQGDSQKLSLLTDAYGKLQAKGRASLEELNRFTENGVPLMDALSEGLGVTTEELFDLVSKGQVGFGDVQDAIAKLTDEGGQFAGLMEEMSKTTAGKFSTALDNLKLAAADLGAELLPLANDIIDAITKAAKSFSGLDTQTQTMILMMGALAAAVGPALTGISALTTALAFLAANPVVAVVGGVAALTAGLVALGQARRRAQIKELEKEFESVAEKTGLATREIEAIERSLARGSFDSFADASHDVEELSASLGISREAIIAVGLKSGDVSEIYKEQLKLLQDQITEQSILNSLSETTSLRQEQQLMRQMEMVEAQRLVAEEIQREAEARKEAEARQTVIRKINQDYSFYSQLIAGLDKDSATYAERKLDILNKQLSIRQDYLEMLEEEAKADGVLTDEELARIKNGESLVNSLSREIESLKVELDGASLSAGQLFDKLNTDRAFNAQMTDSKVDDLELQRDRELAIFEGTEEQKLRLANWYNKQIADLEIDEARRAAEERIRLSKQAFETAKQAAAENGQYAEYASREAQSQTSNTEVGQMAGFGGGEAADPIAMMIQAAIEFALSMESVQKVLNPFKTILEASRDLLEPLIDDALKPVIGFLEELGVIIGKILSPVITIAAFYLRLFMLRFQPLLLVLRLVGDAFEWLNNKVFVPFGNAVIDVINNFIKAINNILKYIPGAKKIKIPKIDKFKTTDQIAKEEKVLSEKIDRVNDEMERLQQVFEENRKAIEDAYQKNVSSLQKLLKLGALGESEYDQSIRNLNKEKDVQLAEIDNTEKAQLTVLEEILEALNNGKNVSLPSFDVGTISVPRNTLSVVHKGEMIVPESFATGVRNGTVTIGKTGKAAEHHGDSYHVTVNVSGSVLTENNLTDAILKNITKRKKQGAIPAGIAGVTG